MASVTVGQRSSLHMDSEHQLLHKLHKNKLFRRLSGELRAKRSAVKPVCAARALPHKPAGRRCSQVSLDLSVLRDGSAGGTAAGHRVAQGRSGVVKQLRSERPRPQAWCIFSRDAEEEEEKGEGHAFTHTHLLQHDWCDVCNKQVRITALKCNNCSYTCHLDCKELVQLDCNQREKQPGDFPTPLKTASQSQEKNATKEEVEEKPKSLSEPEIKAKIDDYNAKVTENGMKLAEDGTYTGFIKVHLNLRRPVTVSPEVRPTAADKKTSFYLPSDAVKQLHISSSTTVSEVIQGLLKKFMVLDNPRKFALYRRTHRDGQDLFQKLGVSEQPLYLRLSAGPDPERLTFVLKENETCEVEWHAFSVPELHNFLTILQKEELDRVKQVEQRYTAYKQKLLQALHSKES